MKSIDLDALRKLANKASLGTWYAEGKEVYSEDCEFHPIAVCNHFPSCEPEEVCEANAAYIASVSPSVVIGLLDLIEKYQAEIGEK